VSAARVTALHAQAAALEAQALAVRAEAHALEADISSRTAKDAVVYATVTEAARELECSRRTVFDWIAAGMPSIKRGAKRRVPMDQARAWLEARGRT
jgi:excisionase family DNA binding protein